MKRIICFVLSIIFIFSMASCENSNKQSETEDPCAKGHSFVLTNSDLYCYKDGTNTYTCTICKEEKKENAKAVKHDFINDKCKYCDSPSEPIKILNLKMTRSSSKYYRVSCQAKNDSPFNMKFISVYFYALQKQENNYVIVGQAQDNLGVTDYMYSGSILDISRLVESSTEVNACKVIVDAPSFEKYEMIFYFN